MKLLLLQFGASCFLAGLICFVHVVHYPLFDGISETDFQPWHERHVKYTSYVVIIPMLIELATVLALTAAPPPGLRPAAFLGLGLLIIVWAATFFGAVPAHNQLASGFDAVVHQKLLRADLIRTLAWSARAALAAWMLHHFMRTQLAAT